MQLWALHEEVRDNSEGAYYSRLEHMRDGGKPKVPALLGLYSSLELARAALSTRLRPLFNGGDCFTVPCHELLTVTQRWWGEPDGAGMVSITFKKPAEGVPPPPQLYDLNFHQELVLSVAPSVELDVPPPDNWSYPAEEFREAVRPPPPPPTEAELLQAALERERFRLECIRLYGVEPADDDPARCLIPYWLRE